MNKLDLITKVKALDGITQDERAYLINLINTKKKYGLVWEDKPEDVEDLLRENLPVLKEVKDKAIFNGDEFPNHILIEGDNLHALTTLTFTHEGMIDVIYIDPPYNTGKDKEFRYNDKWVTKEDSWRHSSWLSFMHKRLTIAKKLLKEDGIIFISIDDNEISQLKLLCDEVFEYSSNPDNFNFLGTLVWDLGTGTSAGHFTRAHEYILSYSKNKGMLNNFGGGTGFIDDRAQKKISKKNSASEFTFPKGTKFLAEDGFELTEKWGGKEETELIQGRMIAENGQLKEDVTLKAGWTQKNQMKNFFEGKEVLDTKGQKVIEFYFRSNGKIYCRKQREKINPPSVLRKLASTKSGSSTLKDIFQSEEVFAFPKPTELIEFLVGLKDKDSTVLDFFAGSGTSLHATINLNAKDDGNRKCILITNNENNICEEVTYERSLRIINGYKKINGEEVEGLNENNLRYFKNEYVSRDYSLKSKRELTKLATELLCIKEDIYSEIKILSDYKLNSTYLRCFGNEFSYLIIIYDDEVIDQVVSIIKDTIKRSETKTVIFKVYVFSNGQYPYTEEFEDVLKHIKLCALPDAIYKAYQNVLPKKNKQIIPELEEDIEQVNSSLFN